MKMKRNNECIRTMNENTLQFYLFYNLQRKVLSKITQSKHTFIKKICYTEILQLI